MMGSELLSTLVAIACLIFASIYMRHRLRITLIPRGGEQHDHQDFWSSLPEPTELGKTLSEALPESVIFPQHGTIFKECMNKHWAQQECSVVPACIVRPSDVQELSIAVKILKREYDQRRKRAGKGEFEGIFAVRSGGHSPVAGAASIKGGVLIDLSLICEVTPSEERTSVTIGAGARWKDVSRTLEKKGLAVVGGRNSSVGVGGLTLGGGLSFFSPRFGLVCSNIISYKLVLASGSIVTASQSKNPELWRALKGGSNNFGIVTHFQARSFPSTDIWSGFLYLPNSQTAKVLSAFHQSVNAANMSGLGTSLDENAAGPITSFSYIHSIGIQIIAVNLVSTKLPESRKEWPRCWRSSSFRLLWRFWSTCKVRTLTSATDELNALNPPGRRQLMATTTVKNDSATLADVHAIYSKAIVSISSEKIKGLVWTLVLQPLLPGWVQKGDANMLDLHQCTEPLVIVTFTVNWIDHKDDELINSMTRQAIERIEATAAANKTSHSFRYLNYCAGWQRPFESCGDDSLRYLQAMSIKYDPDGLFQRGCVGGFKLHVGYVDT